ncbi:hypothetical protein [Neobacillus vireti]|uniref:hypothetical protein n=1 Tax=Neobacillus vireti TaxID=220686 RepID=UPI003000EB5B
MGLVRLILVSVIFWVLAIILVLILGITFSIWGIQLNEFVENGLQIIIIFYGVNKFGLKKDSKKDNYHDFPRL